MASDERLARNNEFVIRRYARAVLGPDLMAYILHLRPLEWPIMTAHFLLGTLLAVGWNLPWRPVIIGWLVFILLMNGGTMAINSAFDQDEGDVGYLKQPPKPPKYLFHVSMAMLLSSLALGFFLPPLFAWSNAACVVMSILYSAPPVRLKARAGWDLLINCVGFGALTPAAGWGLTGRAMDFGFLLLCLGFTLLFGALYPLTQIYQVEEDRARGDKTLVIRLGEGKSLWLAFLLAVFAHGLFFWAIWLHQNSLLLRYCGLFSLAAWGVVLLPWALGWRRWSMVQHEKGMYRALAAWAITDISVLFLMWP